MAQSIAKVRRPWFTQAFTNNWRLKLLALGLSVMLFALVHSDTDAQRSMFMDVMVMMPPASSGKMLTSELPDQVKVTLSGSRSKLSNLTRADLSPIQIDLSAAPKDFYYFDPHAIEVSGGLQVKAISPASVPLQWAVASEKRVPVRVQLEGELSKALSLRGEVEVDPGYVTLRGPAQRLDSMTTVSTEPVSLLGVGQGDHRRRVPLEPLPEHVSYIEGVEAEVRFTVAPLVAERTFTRLAVAALGERRPSMRPAQVSVTLRGPEESLATLSPEQIVPFIDIAQDATGTQSYDVRLRGVPEGVEITNVSPPSILGRMP